MDACHGASHDGACSKRVIDSIVFEWAEVVLCTSIANESVSQDSSREVVAKPPKRMARRVCEAARESGILETAC